MSAASEGFKFLHTTEVPVATTASQMMAILGRLGASNISMAMVDGEPSGMSFSTKLGDRLVTYRLPVRWQKIAETMTSEAVRARQSRLPSSERVARAKAQAKRTAWRLALEWLKVQAAYVENGIRHPAEVFLADMVVVREGVETTVAELLVHGGGMPLLTGGAR